MWLWSCHDLTEIWRLAERTRDKLNESGMSQINNIFNLVKTEEASLDLFVFSSGVIPDTDMISLTSSFTLAASSLLDWTPLVWCRPVWWLIRSFQQEASQDKHTRIYMCLTRRHNTKLALIWGKLGFQIPLLLLRLLHSLHIQVWLSTWVNTDKHFSNITDWARELKKREKKQGGNISAKGCFAISCLTKYTDIKEPYRNDFACFSTCATNLVL